MPAAKKPAAPRPRAFKEPAALKRLSRSLESAQEALAELRKDTGRDVSQGARDLYGDLRTFVANARRDTGKLTKALQRDFEHAQKQVAGGTTGAIKARPRAAATSRPRTPPTATRTPRKSSR